MPDISTTSRKEDDMPEFDGVTIAAIASFAVLVLAWLFAPSAKVSVAEHELSAAA